MLLIIEPVLSPNIRPAWPASVIVLSVVDMVFSTASPVVLPSYIVAVMVDPATVRVTRYSFVVIENVVEVRSAALYHNVPVAFSTIASFAADELGSTRTQYPFPAPSIRAQGDAAASQEVKL